VLSLCLRLSLRQGLSDLRLLSASVRHDVLRLLRGCRLGSHGELRLLAHDETGLRSHDARAHALIEAAAATLPQYQEDDTGEARHASDEDTRNHARIRIAAVVFCLGETDILTPVFFGPFVKTIAMFVRIAITFWINQMIATQTGSGTNTVVGHAIVTVVVVGFAVITTRAKVIHHRTAAGRTKITLDALVMFVASEIAHAVRFAHRHGRIRRLAARIIARPVRLAVCLPVAVRRPTIRTATTAVALIRTRAVERIRTVCADFAERTRSANLTTVIAVAILALGAVVVRLTRIAVLLPRIVQPAPTAFLRRERRPSRVHPRREILNRARRSIFTLAHPGARRDIARGPVCQRTSRECQQRHRHHQRAHSRRKTTTSTSPSSHGVRHKLRLSFNSPVTD